MNVTSLNGATLIPAYGRDYKSRAEAIASFVNGKDWQVASIFHGSGYCGIADLQEGEWVSLRYDRNRKVCSYVKGGDL